MADEQTENPERAFRIFRTLDAPLLMESNVMTIQPLAAETSEALGRAINDGYLEGDVVRVVFNIPGFSLTHVWFKKGYPLTRHSHDVDCLYYIIAGELQMGTATLGPRDGFFVPANSMYSYRPGPSGVELLEFRNATAFDIKIANAAPAFWDRAIETCRANRSDWQDAKPPEPVRLPT